MKGVPRVITDTENISVATNTKVTVGNTSTSVLSANSSRTGFALVNDSDEDIYVSLSGTAVMNEGIRINSDGGSVIDDAYRGAITAICTTGGKNLTVMEY